MWTILTGTPGTFYRIAVTSVPMATTATIDMGLAHPAILAREAWLARYPELSFADTAEHASPAGDGIANLVKRALGLNPTIHAYSGKDPQAHHLPVLETLADGRIRLVFTRDPADPSLVIKGQVSHSRGAGWYQRIDPVALEDGREAVYMPRDERQKLMRLIVSGGG